MQKKIKITQLTAQINNYAEIDKTIDEQTKIRDELCEKRENLKDCKEKLQEQQKVLSAKRCSGNEGKVSVIVKGM